MRLDDSRRLTLAAALFVLGCGAGVTPTASNTTDPGNGTAALSARDPDDDPPRFHIVPRNVHVAGKTTLGWIPEFWRYLYSVPASRNPELVDAASCGVDQSGPVFFIPGEQHDVYTRSCNVPAHTPVLWAIWSLFNDYPCPDPSFQPAPGQSLEQLLAEGAQGFDDAVTHLAATIDGRPIDVNRHRHTTGLVSFTGDPTLTSTFDGCVTGGPQVGVADGWYVLLRLSSGDHTLVVTATSPGGHATSQTFLLHVLGEDD